MQTCIRIRKKEGFVRQPPGFRQSQILLQHVAAARRARRLAKVDGARHRHRVEDGRRRLEHRRRRILRFVHNHLDHVVPRHRQRRAVHAARRKLRNPHSTFALHLF